MAGPVNSLVDSLAAYGGIADCDVPIGRAALLLAAVFHPDISLARYETHLEKMIGQTDTRHKELLKAGAEDNLETRLAALKYALAEQHGYAPDTKTPEHIQNADMIRVIDRGKGGPAALSILYMNTALALGWPAYGLDIAGYCAVRMDKDGQRLIFDPCEGCLILQAPDLRRLVKQTMGAHAELSADYYEPVSHRDILLGLQNHIKLRQIESEDYEGALKSVEAMRALAPDEYRLLLDAGVLYARTKSPQKAVEALEAYISKAPDARDRQEAAFLLREVRELLEE